MKKKINKHSPAIQKCAHNKLHNIISKYNDTYHRIIKMKSSDAKLSAYVDLDVKNNDEDVKFKAGDHVRISKYKTF